MGLKREALNHLLFYFILLFSPVPPTVNGTKISKENQKPIMTEPDSALSFPQVYFPAGCQHIKSPGAFQGVLHFSQFGKSDIFF